MPFAPSFDAAVLSLLTANTGFLSSSTFLPSPSNSYFKGNDATEGLGGAIYIAPEVGKLVVGNDVIFEVSICNIRKEGIGWNCSCLLVSSSSIVRCDVRTPLYRFPFLD